MQLQPFHSGAFRNFFRPRLPKRPAVACRRIDGTGITKRTHPRMQLQPFQGISPPFSGPFSCWIDLCEPIHPAPIRSLNTSNPGLFRRRIPGEPRGRLPSIWRCTNYQTNPSILPRATPNQPSVLPPQHSSRRLPPRHPSRRLPSRHPLGAFRPATALAAFRPATPSAPSAPTPPRRLPARHPSRRLPTRESPSGTLAALR
jgi:hypothetical protein